MDTLGEAMGDIISEAADLGEDVLERAVQTYKEIGAAIASILEAALEVLGGAFGTVVSILFRLLASYRPMKPEEIADARTVFADTLDYSKIFFASESLANDIVFGVQDFVTQNPESRAFVSNNLVNFDVDEGIERHTMIHELTHVWQAEFTGPFYMSEAIHAQVLGSGYNYGYDESATGVDVDRSTTPARRSSINGGDAIGEGGQAELLAADGDFESFNREQQGQILMHYFVRKELLGQAESDWEPWEKYVEFVQAA